MYLRTAKKRLIIVAEINDSLLLKNKSSQNIGSSICNSWDYE